MTSNEGSPIRAEEVDVERETVGTTHLVRNQDGEGDEWTPDVPAGEQPVLGTVFESLELEIVMYRTYAEKAGFDTRLSTDKKNERKETTHRYDLNMIVGDADVDMLLKMVKEKKSYAPNFSYSYRTENDELTSLFWEDEVAKFNYMEFGDVISFDATFRTNKYGMVFVPFTGIDNHKSSVTLCVALLSDETADSYK